MANKYQEYIPMTQKILTKKVEVYCEENGFEVERIRNPDNYNPTKEMIPSLVESVKFWKNQRPKGRSKNWTKLQWTLYWQIKSKELICLDLLAKADSAFWVKFVQTNG